MRIVNSSTELYERRMAATEGGVAATAVASHPIARALVILTLAEAGDRVVTISSEHGSASTHFQRTLPRLGIRTASTEPDDLKAVAAAIDHQTRAVYCETSGDPVHDRLTIVSLARLARDFNVPLVVDHGVGSPVVKPIPLGADIVLRRCAPRDRSPAVDYGSVIIDAGHFPWRSTARFQRWFGHEETVGSAFSMRLRSEMLPAIGAPMSPLIASELLCVFDDHASICDADSRSAVIAGCAA